MLKPILKWAGGKRQLLPELRDLIRKVDYQDYYEPFLGGGAVFFDIATKSNYYSYINDINEELINLYTVVRDKASYFLENIEIHRKNDNSDYYLKIRYQDRESSFQKQNPILRAARTFYLNRTAYGGLYRVNSRGEFNVPYANHKKKLSFDVENIENVSNFLNNKNIIITNKDYKKVLENCKMGDLVFLDPPYFPINKKNSFDSYQKDSFGKTLIDKKKMQIELRNIVFELINKGVYVIMCNSDTEFIREIYQSKSLRIMNVSINRFINSNTLQRSKKHNSEVIITNIKEQR